MGLGISSGSHWTSVVGSCCVLKSRWVWSKGGFDVFLTVVMKREGIGACGAEVDGPEFGNFDGVSRSLRILHIIAFVWSIGFIQMVWCAHRCTTSRFTQTLGRPSYSMMGDLFWSYGKLQLPVTREVLASLRGPGARIEVQQFTPGDIGKTQSYAPWPQELRLNDHTRTVRRGSFRTQVMVDFDQNHLP